MWIWRKKSQLLSTIEISVSGQDLHGKAQKWLLKINQDPLLVNSKHPLRYWKFCGASDDPAVICFAVAVVNTMAESNLWGGKGFILACNSGSPSIAEEGQDRNSSKSGGMMLTGSRPDPRSAVCLSRYCMQLHQPRHGTAHSHQRRHSLYRQGHRPVWSGQFLSWSSFLTCESRLC